MAVGNYAGAPGLAWADPDAGDHPLSEHDPYWWDITVTYVDYAIGQFQRWRRSPRRHRSRTVRFQDWRRSEDPYRRTVSGPFGPNGGDLDVV